MKQQEDKVMTYEQEMQYELAKDIIGWLAAALSRYAEYIKDRNNKDSILHNDSPMIPYTKERESKNFASLEQEIEAFENRERELRKEKKILYDIDDKKMQEVIDTYSALLREYDEDKRSEKQKAAEGIDLKFIETKVDYDAFGV